MSLLSVFVLNKAHILSLIFNLGLSLNLIFHYYLLCSRNWGTWVKLKCLTWFFSIMTLLIRLLVFLEPVTHFHIKGKTPVLPSSKYWVKTLNNKVMVEMLFALISSYSQIVYLLFFQYTLDLLLLALWNHLPTTSLIPSLPFLIAHQPSITLVFGILKYDSKLFIPSSHFI